MASFTVMRADRRPSTSGSGGTGGGSPDQIVVVHDLTIVDREQK